MELEICNILSTMVRRGLSCTVFFIIVCSILFAGLTGCSTSSSTNNTTSRNTDNITNSNTNSSTKNSLTNSEASNNNIDEVTYHNEKYGFTLSIPREYYQNLRIEERSTGANSKNISFIYSIRFENGTGMGGTLFRIYIFSKTAGDNSTKNYMKLLGENDSYNFYFWTITEPIEDMAFEIFYNENSDKILKIDDTFKLD